MMRGKAAWLAAALAVAALGAAAGAAAQARDCRYQDLLPAYTRFAAATAHVPPAARAATFLRQIAQRFPDYYSPEVFGDADRLRARALRFFDPAQRAALLANVAPLTDAHLAAFAAVVGPQFAAQQAAFTRTFADFRCDSTVEFGVSLLKFDGHPADFGGRPHLLFGVDTIAALHEPVDMPAFFDHELFHLYHQQVVGSHTPRGEEPAWWTMWKEGLATYVSQRMNPALDARHVLWYPRDMVPRMERNLARAAQLMLADMDRSDEAGTRWFLADRQVQDLPPRAGYFLGYRFAKAVGDGAPLPQLARMAPEEVREKERTFLAHLAQTPAVGGIHP